MDTLAHVVYYPQKPLVCTILMDFLQFKELPPGCKATVEIACYTWYNQEDFMICNQSSVNRGLFISAFSHTYSDNQEKDNQFETPDFRKCACRRHDCNDKIDIDGFINPGS
jgi:DNA-directed RNA polymerase II subunit RPB2